jgi:hypothetical protein
VAQAGRADDPGRFATGSWLVKLSRRPEIEAIAHGAVILRRRSGGRNWTRRDRVSLDRLEQASEHILRVFGTQDYLDSLDDDRQLLDGAFAIVEQHRLEETRRCRGGRAELEGTVLSLDEGLAFRTALDDHTAGLVPLLNGARPLRVLAQLARNGARGRRNARFESAASLPSGACSTRILVRGSSA